MIGDPSLELKPPSVLFPAAFAPSSPLFLGELDELSLLFLVEEFDLDLDLEELLDLDLEALTEPPLE